MKKLTGDAIPEEVTRKSVALPASIWTAINDFRFAGRFTTEAAAIRHLILAGLATQEIHAPADSKATEKPASTSKKANE